MVSSTKLMVPSSHGPVLLNLSASLAPVFVGQVNKVDKAVSG